MAETKATETKVTETKTKVKGGNTVSKVENKKPETKKEVTVNDVKPQITFVKRHLHKFLEEKKIAGVNSSKTKPELKKGVDQKTITMVKGEMTKLYNKMLKKYSYTSKAQQTYIKNHLTGPHTKKYITRETQ